jgi:acetoin utilization deacetylase AcuC-like enzyme
MSHGAMLGHDPGVWHPERSERLAAAIRGVRAAPVEVVYRGAPQIEPALLATVHHHDYIEQIRATATEMIEIDHDTIAGPGSWRAALHAAGAGPAAVEFLRAGGADVAFLAIRPPGHHALPDRGMGFCLFNNIAITARLLADGGARVAIVDWDIHHGNATQDEFLLDPSVLYVSLHEFPFYPGTGWVEEVGVGPGAGTTVNVAVPKRTAGDIYQEAFGRVIEPVITRFEPDWVLVSAGYDGHRGDPLAETSLLEVDFQWIASQVAKLSPSGRVIPFLEGGYNLAAVERSITATMVGLTGSEPSVVSETPSPRGARRILDLLVEALKP